MIKRKFEIDIEARKNKNGGVKMYMSNLADFAGKNEKLRKFAHIKLNVGEEVEYHIHTGESESFYILSGKGLYNDNGYESQIYPHTATFTPSGEGHALKNIGTEPLEFIALIIRD